MHLHTFFSFALVALTTSTYAFPLVPRTNEKNELFVPAHEQAKVGTVNIISEFLHRRQNQIDAALAATPTTKPGAAKDTGTGAVPKGTAASKRLPGAAKGTGAGSAPAKATTPADLPGCPAPAAAPAGTGKAPKPSAAGNGTAKATGKKNVRAAAAATGSAPKPLGCDPTKPQIPAVAPEAPKAAKPAASKRAVIGGSSYNVYN